MHLIMHCEKRFVVMYKSVNSSLPMARQLSQLFTINIISPDQTSVVKWNKAEGIHVHSLKCVLMKLIFLISSCASACNAIKHKFVC